MDAKEMEKLYSALQAYCKNSQRKGPKPNYSFLFEGEPTIAYGFAGHKNEWGWKASLNLMGNIFFIDFEDVISGTTTRYKWLGDYPLSVSHPLGLNVERVVKDFETAYERFYLIQEALTSKMHQYPAGVEPWIEEVSVTLRECDYIINLRIRGVDEFDTHRQRILSIEKWQELANAEGRPDFEALFHKN